MRPPPAQINTRRGAPIADNDGSPKRGSLPGHRLTLSTTRLDLGDGKPNEIVRGELTLSNPNSSPVAFSLVKHCGCTELSPLSGELPPGTTETIRVGVELPRHANSEKNTRIDVQTGDPPAIVASCVLSARCPAPFQVTPAFISFGSVAKDELASVSAEIRVDSVAGQPPLDAAKLLTEHAHDGFRVERDTTTAPAVLLRVTLKDGLPEGDVYDALEIRPAGDDRVMRVPLHVSVVEPISVVPRTVMLRKHRDGGSFAPVELFIMARAGRTLAGVVLVDAPAGVHIDDLGEVVPGRRRIRLSVISDTDEWPAESEVWLTSDGASQRFGFKLKKPTPL